MTVIGGARARAGHRWAGLAVALMMAATGCRRTADATAAGAPRPILTVGFGLSGGQSAQAGVRQAVRNLSVEGLIAVTREGRLQPWLAERWNIASDGLTVSIHLRPGVRFHDGTPLTAAVVRDIIVDRLPEQMGSAVADISSIDVVSDSELAFRLKRRSAFLLESLDVLIEKPGSSFGTGPFVPEPRTQDQVRLRANETHHSGTPALSEIVVRAYASTRAAWADLLRGNLDMLYEVGTDGLSSFERSTNVSVFTFVRPYQFVVVLNPRSPKLRDPSIRRALNAAIDRPALVRDAIDGHGVPSAGPIYPQHWAFSTQYQAFAFDPKSAARTAGIGRLQLTCLVPPDTTYERVALVVKRQLEALGMSFVVQEASNDQIGRAFRSGEFEAALIDVVSGPTPLRPSRWWHSQGPQNVGFSSAPVDGALDRVRHAANEDEYRAGVGAFQQAIVEDPPAIFLAWSERARAVSTRFDVPVEPGRDILSTLRLWRPLGRERPESPH
jgi:peptide/nickel transport system substrate-binding protein